MAKELTTANGIKVILEDRYLDDAFCEAAKKYYAKKSGMRLEIMNTYFIARAVETYIVENNLQPVYEEESV